MLKKNLWLLLLIVSFALAGCNFDFKYPITSEPSQPVDQRLLGKWVSRNDGQKTNGKPQIVTISTTDNRHYIVSFSDSGSGWHAWSSSYPGAPAGLFTIMSDSKFSYAKVISISGDSFKISFAGADSDKSGSDAKFHPLRGVKLNSIATVQAVIRDAPIEGGIFQQYSTYERVR